MENNDCGGARGGGKAQLQGKKHNFKKQGKVHFSRLGISELALGGFREHLSPGK